MASVALHEKHENECHQNKSDDNGVYEVMQGDTGGTTLVAGNTYFRDRTGTSPDFISSTTVLMLSEAFDQVLPGALDDVQRDNVSAVQATEAFLLLVPILTSATSFRNIFAPD
jgi:hypothetical protein